MKNLVFFMFICFFVFLSNCASVHDSTYTFTSDERIELRYPVVLVHGVGRNDIGRYFQPWGRIPQLLRAHGIEVYFGNTDAWGDIISNAGLLKSTIDTILENTGHEKVNIIAHSKGGIDSRYLIWRYDYGDKVASLTTIATPHSGAEMADFFFSSKAVQARFAQRGLRDIIRRFGDVNPDIYSVNHNLTTENMNEFNTNITRDARVHYQSVYSVMHDPSDDPAYSLSYAHIKSISGENDGMVSARSARWGDAPIRLPISISHSQIVDQGSARHPDMEILNIYLEIVRELAERGF